MCLPVLEPGGRIEIREYDLADWTGDTPGEVSAQDVCDAYYTAEVTHAVAAQAMVYTLAQPHPTLPYMYFRFRGVEYYATEASYSTGMRRYLELLALAQAVIRVEAWEGHHVLQA